MKLDDLKASAAQDHSTAAFYVSFSDLMVLLCAFFVMLLSMSKLNLGSFDRLKSELTGSTNGTLVELADALREAIKGTRGISVSLDEDGVRITLDSAMLFDSASAELKTAAMRPLFGLLNRIRGSSYQLDVEGHTDDRRYYKMGDDTFDTNWSLSGRRASSMVHYLIEMGFAEERLRIIGYAANRPKVAIKNKSGEELERARALNRRVSILVH